MIPRNMLKTPLNRFRLVAFLEGTSYLALLLITMPLKYLADMPQPNQIIGMMHGVLTVLYVIALIDFAREHRPRWTRIALLFAASLLPFGTFYADAKWLRPLAADA